MTPFHFVTTTANSNHNTPAGDIQKAMWEDLQIRSAADGWKVLSYYYDSTTKKMVLDIEPVHFTYEDGWNAYVAHLYEAAPKPVSKHIDFKNGWKAANKASNKRDIDWM